MVVGEKRGDKKGRVRGVQNVISLASIRGQGELGKVLQRCPPTCKRRMLNGRLWSLALLSEAKTAVGFLQEI